MSQTVYDMIRGLIMRGDYIGGDPMPEEELAEKLSVSRTPVREALRRLQAEGIIERRANRRVHLAEVNPRMVVEIFAVRARLEPLAARLAASRVDAAFLALLGNRVERMEEARLAPRPDLRLYRQANEDFHWAILTQSGSPTLDVAVRNVARRNFTSPTFKGWMAAELERSQAHHRELLDAFGVANPDWAEAVMTAHLHAAHTTYQRLAKAHEAPAAPEGAP